MDSEVKTFTERMEELRLAARRYTELTRRLSEELHRTPECVWRWANGLCEPPRGVLGDVERIVSEFYGEQVTWQQLFPRKAERLRQRTERSYADRP
ncbi:MAG: hypothetical protein LUC33_04730 [Prevotellaceae bacterium]|nr:hypothetical protein [Prevotellaceae bacterium]